MIDKSKLVKGIRIVLRDGTSCIVDRVNIHTVRVKFRDGSQSTINIYDIIEVVVRTCDKCKKSTAIPGERFCNKCRIFVQGEIEKTRIQYVPAHIHEKLGRKARSTELLGGQVSEDDYSEDSLP